MARCFNATESKGPCLANGSQAGKGAAFFFDGEEFSQLTVYDSEQFRNRLIETRSYPNSGAFDLKCYKLLWNAGSNKP